jgi:hypothetical protein
MQKKWKSRHGRDQEPLLIQTEVAGFAPYISGVGVIGFVPGR